MRDATPGIYRLGDTNLHMQQQQNCPWAFDNEDDDDDMYMWYSI